MSPSALGTCCAGEKTSGAVGKATRATPGTAEELRELTRAAHEAVRDLRQVLASTRGANTEITARFDQAGRELVAALELRWQELDDQWSQDLTVARDTALAELVKQADQVSDYLCQLLGCQDRADVITRMSGDITKAITAAVENCLQNHADVVTRRLEALVDDHFNGKMGKPNQSGPPLSVELHPAMVRAFPSAAGEKQAQPGAAGGRDQ